MIVTIIYNIGLSLSYLHFTKYIEFNIQGLWCLTPLSTIFQLHRGDHIVLLVEETGGPGVNHRPAESH